MFLSLTILGQSCVLWRECLLFALKYPEQAIPVLMSSIWQWQVRSEAPPFKLPSRLELKLLPVRQAAESPFDWAKWVWSSGGTETYSTDCCMPCMGNQQDQQCGFSGCLCWHKLRLPPKAVVTPFPPALIPALSLSWCPAASGWEKRCCFLMGCFGSVAGRAVRYGGSQPTALPVQFKDLRRSEIQVVAQAVPQTSGPMSAWKAPQDCTNRDWKL